MKTSAKLVLAVLVTIFAPPSARADLSIFEIQHTTVDGDASQYDGSVINCLGGIVIHRVTRGQPRLVLYDPDHADGWGGIWVKDWMGTLVSNVALGDWVALSEVYVEEYRGGTILQYDDVYNNTPGFSFVSRGLELPDPIVVDAGAIAAPLSSGSECKVLDHSAELYEAMLLRVMDVGVTAIDLGKDVDNYNLHDSSGDDLWAADYLNVNRVGDYLPAISVGENFVSVTGILEQYTGEKNGIDWDYYQLLTRTADDVVVPEPATISMLIIMAGLAVLRISVFRKR